MYSWVFIGVLDLLILTYQDYKKNMIIDDRYNWFMMGLTFSLLAYFSPKWYYLIGLIVFMVIITTFMSKLKVLGSGDVNSIRWIIMGFGIMGILTLAWFLIFLIIILILHRILYEIFKKINKINENIKVQGYPIVIISFILTVYLFVN